MFSQFPIMMASVDNIATVKSTLSGVVTVTTGSKQVTCTTPGNFVIETAVGSQLFITINDVKTSIGYIGQIINEHLLLLEDAAVIDTVESDQAVVHNYKAGYKLAPNGFLSPRNANVKFIADFFTRVSVSRRYVQNTAILLPYTVLENESPEMVSYKFYDTPFYHWVLLLINDIVDPRREWVLSERLLMKRLELEYPGTSLDNPYEYRNNDTGYVEDEDADNVTAISIRDYAIEQNELKRSIKVLQPTFIGEFVRNYYNELSSPL